MPDPHKRRTPQNTRGMNDLITKREAYHGTKRMIDAALDQAHERHLTVTERLIDAHIAQYHTPAWRKLWRRITRRIDA